MKYTTFLFLFFVDFEAFRSFEILPRKNCLKYSQCPKIVAKIWVKKGTHDEVHIMSAVEEN